jgi:nucleoside-diphosphate-sugar epimerase
MKVLVTGGLGMIGASVVRELLVAGHVPVVLDRHEGPGVLAESPARSSGMLATCSTSTSSRSSSRVSTR